MARIATATARLRYPRRPNEAKTNSYYRTRVMMTKVRGTIDRRERGPYISSSLFSRHSSISLVRIWMVHSIAYRKGDFSAHLFFLPHKLCSEDYSLGLGWLPISISFPSPSQLCHFWAWDLREWEGREAALLRGHHHPPTDERERDRG